MTGFEPVTYSLRVKIFEGKNPKCGGFCVIAVLYYKCGIIKNNAV